MPHEKSLPILASLTGGNKEHLLQQMASTGTAAAGIQCRQHIWVEYNTLYLFFNLWDYLQLNICLWKCTCFLFHHIDNTIPPITLNSCTSEKEKLLCLDTILKVPLFRGKIIISCKMDAQHQVGIRFGQQKKRKKNINVELLLLSFVQSREQVIKKTSNEATDEFYDRIMTWETTGSFVSVSDLKSIICKPLN